MENKLNKKRNVIIAASFLLLILIIIGLFFLMQPQRTLSNFCIAAKEEKGNFKASTSYDKLLESFRKLDGVAPNEIHSDTSFIVKGYESIVSDPSKNNFLRIRNQRLSIAS